MKITLHQLEIFAEVAKQLSITKAAEALRMTQPAVSIQMKLLEQRCGIALTEIIGKKVYLTDAGRDLYETYQEIISRLDYIESSFKQRQGKYKGSLRISIVTTAQYFIPNLLGKFHKHYPDVDIKLSVTNREAVIERLKRNEDDLVILSQIPKQLAIKKEPILYDKLVVVAHPKHPIAKEKSIRLKEILEEPLLIREKGSGTRMAMEKVFTQAKLKPNIIMELGSGEAIKQAAMSGMGVSLLSEISIQQELKLRKIAVLDVKGFPVMHPWYAVWLEQKKLSPIAHAFLEFILADREIKG